MTNVPDTNAGGFVYAGLGVGAYNPYPTLYQGATYYLMSQETNNGDYWYDDWNTTLNVLESMGTINAAASSSNLVSFVNYPNSSGEGYVPVNLEWFLRPIVGKPSMAGAVFTQITNLVSPYTVSTIDLSSFPDHIR